MSHLPHRVFVGHIRGDGKSVTAHGVNFAGATFRGLCNDVSEREFGAFSCIAEGDGAANSATATGNNRYFIVYAGHRI